MGRIVAQLKLTSFVDPDKTLVAGGLVDTGAAYIYIALEQAGAAVDMLGHRLIHVKHVDLK